VRLEIRRALIEEATVLTEIAQASKRYWGYPEHWIQHWKHELTILPEFIANNDVFVAEVDGKLVGFYALAVQRQNSALEHLWLLPEQIGKGIGKQLFFHAMERAAARKAREIGISADPNAENFYLKMGATRSGSITSEIDGQPRILPRLKVDVDPS